MRLFLAFAALAATVCWGDGLQNGDFEGNGYDGWVSLAEGTGTVTVVGGGPSGSGHYAQLTGFGGPPGDPNQNMSGLSQLFNCGGAPGRNYCSVTFDYLFTGEQGHAIIFNGRSGMAQRTPDFDDTNGAWKRGYVFVEDPGCNDDIIITFATAKGTLCVDNVVASCDVTPEPSSLASMGCVLAGMVWLKRRK